MQNAGLSRANRLKTVTGKAGDTVEYTQENKYNGFGQRVEKIEGSDVTNYFYDGTKVHTDKGFIAAGKLKAGDELRLESGEEAFVETIEEIQLDQPIKVYNFEVEDFHTYYVSEQKVLVHNTCAETTKVSRIVESITTQYIDANQIRFSQSSVNGAAEIIENMSKNGWQGDAIDVIVMPDGGLTSVDNTRLLATKLTGTTVKARIHEYNELLPTRDLIKRFTKGKAVPKTWGDAVTIRIQNQNSGYRKTYPMGSYFTGWKGN